MITQQIDTEPLLEEWKQTEDHLLKVISTFPDENFHTLPFEGSWTAAQVCDHVSKSLSGVVISLSQQNEPAKRKYDEHVNQLRSIFLNFNEKYQSPSSILPEKKPIDRKDMYKRLKDLGDKINEAIQTSDLSQLCTLYSFPNSGNLTRFEWISFSCFHTQRHTFQLEKIFSHLNNNYGGNI